MEIKEAIEKAKSFVSEVLAGEEASQIRVEEIEFDEPEDAWLITIGVMRPSVNKKAFSNAYLPEVPLKRTYKVVKIPNNSLKLPSMKIRQIGFEE